MPESHERVQLDLNNPGFLDSWFALDPVAAERVRTSFKKLTRLTWPEVYKDKGLRWERVRSIAPPPGVAGLYSFRLGRAERGAGYRDGPVLRVLLVSADHDATYGRK
jgi:hypothetical protein